MRLDEGELIRWGRRIGESARTPVWIGLSGPLGAGKSVLARAIGAGAGVSTAMPSPTFNLLFRYDGAARDVVHLDLYRLDSADEVWELGWSDLGADGEIVIVEWPARAGPHLPADHWSIALSVPPRQPLLRDVEVRRVGAPPPLPGFPIRVSTGG